MAPSATLDTGETLRHSQHGDVTFREVIIKASERVYIRSDTNEDPQYSSSSETSHLVHFIDEDGAEHREPLSEFAEETALIN